MVSHSLNRSYRLGGPAQMRVGICAGPNHSLLGLSSEWLTHSLNAMSGCTTHTKLGHAQSYLRIASEDPPDEPWRVARAVPLRHHRPVTQGRLDRAAVFIARLHALSIKSPHSWRRAESIGRDVGLAGLPLEQALDDAEKAGLIHRREDDAGLILLTAAGRAAASQ